MSATSTYTISPAVAGEANASGVSWAAVIAGAFVTSALVLILLSLGAGLGLSTISPWSNTSATGVTATAILWLFIMEAVSSATGGYIAGRLRTKWTTIHTDEVYFRDTAHGFLAWSTALVFTAAFLATAATTMVGASVSSRGEDAAPMMVANASTTYFVDTMFRNPPSVVGQPSTASTFNPDASVVGDAMPGSTRARTMGAIASHPEAAAIFANGLKQGALPAEDQNYLTQVVAQQTGVGPDEANRRVTTAFANAQAAANAARRATANTLLWTFIALLIGAFCASFAATIGGRERDNIKAI